MRRTNTRIRKRRNEGEAEDEAFCGAAENDLSEINP